MKPEVALARMTDGMNTLLRETGLPGGPGIPSWSDWTGTYEMKDRYEPNRTNYATEDYNWKDFQYVGFLCGRLWLLARLTGDSRYSDVAAELCRRIEPVLSKGPVTSENCGFDITYALAWGYNFTKETWYRDAALRALENFSQGYRPELNLFMCDADSDEVVIDTAGPFVCFLWGGNFEPRLREMLKTHMDKILELGLVKEDGECFQGLQFDLKEAKIKRYYSRQGYTYESRWTRAQAWGVHNYLNGYEATRDTTHLDVAVRAAQWFWDRLPETMVNHYDYDDPRVPRVPLDTCSSFMVANAMIRFGRMPEVRDGAEWAKRGRQIVERVCADHMTYCGTILHGSWGQISDRLGIGRWPQEDVMGYGNYWSAECLYRLMSDDWSVAELNQK